MGTVFLSLLAWETLFSKRAFLVFIVEHWRGNEHSRESKDAICKDGTRPMTSRSNQEVTEGTIPALWENFIHADTHDIWNVVSILAHACVEGVPGSPS